MVLKLWKGSRFFYIEIDHNLSDVVYIKALNSTNYMEAMSLTSERASIFPLPARCYISNRCTLK